LVILNDIPVTGTITFLIFFEVEVFPELPCESVIMRNPVKGFIRKLTPEESKKYEDREERLKKEGKK